MDAARLHATPIVTSEYYRFNIFCQCTLLSALGNPFGFELLVKAKDDHTVSSTFASAPSISLKSSNSAQIMLCNVDLLWSISCATFHTLSHAPESPHGAFAPRTNAGHATPGAHSVSADRGEGERVLARQFRKK